MSIGVDIVHFPPVIFLDEPTSGLDSTTALSVIDSLKQLAQQQNCTVVMTIHQPSTRLFNLLDRVVFLSAGHVTYSGSVDGLHAYIKDVYLEADLGAQMMCLFLYNWLILSYTYIYFMLAGVPPIANPPEVFLDLCDELTSQQRLEIVTAKHCRGGAETEASVQKMGSAQLHGEGSYANATMDEIVILSHRAFTNVTRTPELFLARVGSSIGFAILVGTLFLDTKETTLGLQHRLSYFVFCIAFFYYTSLEALPIFLAEREIFQREYSRGAYRAISYTVATQLVTLPFNLLLATIFSSITWWLVGLENAPGPFFFHILCIFSVLVAGQTFATMMSVIVPNPMAGEE